MENKLQIEYIPIGELIPYLKNPRYNDKAVDIVAKSIKAYGFNVPILLDKNNTIIAGHTRLKAAVKLGLTEVPVIWVDNLTEEQIKAFRIMDNKTHEYAIWNNKLLKEELIELQDLAFDLSLTGFNEEELRRIIDMIKLDDIKLDGEVLPSTSQIRMVQLFFNQQKYDEFMAITNKFAKRLNTSNITDTIWQILHEADKING